MKVTAIVRRNYINDKIVLEFENCFTGEKFSKETIFIFSPSIIFKNEFLVSIFEFHF